MTTARSRRLRPRLLGIALVAASLALALRTTPAALDRHAAAQNTSDLAPRALAAAIERLRAAESETLRVAPVASARDATPDALRAALTPALNAAGARLRSIDVVDAPPGAAGLLRRRLVLRVAGPSSSLPRALAAVRAAAPTLLTERVTLDAAAATPAAPEPQLIVEGILWVAPLRESGS